MLLELVHEPKGCSSSLPRAVASSPRVKEKLAERSLLRVLGTRARVMVGSESPHPRVARLMAPATGNVQAGLISPWPRGGLGARYERAPEDQEGCSLQRCSKKACLRRRAKSATYPPAVAACAISSAG